MQLWCLVKKVERGPIIKPLGRPINITKGRAMNQGLITGPLPNYSSLPLAAAADPAKGKVWVYYVDYYGIVNNAWTDDKGNTWATGEAIDAQIKLVGNHYMSVYYDQNYEEPRIVHVNLRENCLCDAYLDDTGWQNDYIHY